jgi:hypothetical protein
VTSEGGWAISRRPGNDQPQSWSANSFDTKVFYARFAGLINLPSSTSAEGTKVAIRVGSKGPTRSDWDYRSSARFRGNQPIEHQAGH